MVQRMLADWFEDGEKVEDWRREGIGKLQQAHSKWVRAEWVYEIMGGRGGVPSFLFSFLFGYSSLNSCFTVCAFQPLPSDLTVCSWWALMDDSAFLLIFVDCFRHIFRFLLSNIDFCIFFHLSSSAIFFWHSLNVRVLFSAKLQTFFLKMFWSMVRRQNSKYFGASRVQRGWGEADEPHNNLTIALVVGRRMMCPSWLLSIDLKIIRLACMLWRRGKRIGELENWVLAFVPKMWSR